MSSKVSNPPSKKTLILGQISDSHLFARKDTLHCGVNVYDNLKKVLADISLNAELDYLIFTGDLTQDHSEKSYQNFAAAVQQSEISKPILYLAGNHDDYSLLEKHLSVKPFLPDSIIHSEFWQVQLVASKSGTPAGFVNEQSLQALKLSINKDKNQLLMMHHHPVDVGYFIDKHGLTNKDDFWQVLSQYQNIAAVACGHVHRASKIDKHTAYKEQSVDVYTCPATSIQFDPSVDTVSALAQGPSYRLFYLYPDGTIDSKIISV